MNAQNIQKLSISLPWQQYQFIEDYQAAHHYKNRSAVIKAALYLLQEHHLKICYQEAAHETDPDWDVTIKDGLDNDETW